MAAIEVLIYSHRGIGRQRILLLVHGNDTMVILRDSIKRASCYIVLLKESVGRHGKHDMPDVLTLGLK
jgi:hypothetical protein